MQLKKTQQLLQDINLEHTQTLLVGIYGIISTSAFHITVTDNTTLYNTSHTGY